MKTMQIKDVAFARYERALYGSPLHDITRAALERYDALDDAGDPARKEAADAYWTARANSDDYERALPRPWTDGGLAFWRHHDIIVVPGGERVMPTADHAALMTAQGVANALHAELMAAEPSAEEMALQERYPAMPRERLVRLVVGMRGGAA